METSQDFPDAASRRDFIRQLLFEVRDSHDAPIQERVDVMTEALDNIDAIIEAASK